MLPDATRCPLLSILLHLELHPTSRPSVTRAGVTAGRFARLPLAISLCVHLDSSHLSVEAEHVEKAFPLDHWRVFCPRLDVSGRAWQGLGLTGHSPRGRNCRSRHNP